MTATSSLAESVIVAPSGVAARKKWSQIGCGHVRQSGARQDGCPSANSLTARHFITVDGNGCDSASPTALQWLSRSLGGGTPVALGKTIRLHLQVVTIGEEITLS